MFSHLYEINKKYIIFVFLYACVSWDLHNIFWFAAVAEENLMPPKEPDKVGVVHDCKAIVLNSI